jgi:hypothetical protein
MHVRRSVIAVEVLITYENYARYENLFDVYSPLLMCSQEIVRMPHSLHVLHKRKVVGFRTHKHRRFLESLMQGTESEDSVLDSGLYMAELHDFLAPQFRIEEFGPIWECTVLKVMKRSIFHGVR